MAVCGESVEIRKSGGGLARAGRMWEDELSKSQWDLLVSGLSTGTRTSSTGGEHTETPTQQETE